MADLTEIVRDLIDEGNSLDELVAPLGVLGWQEPTPAPGWSIAHQIAHLRWTDQAAIAAITDSDRWQAILDSRHSSPHLVDEQADSGAAQHPDELLATWRQSRKEVAEALLAVPAGTKLPWFGPPMNPLSMATARLMETWAHGQDVADGLDIERVPTDRIRHVAYIAYRARDFAFAANNLQPPAEPFYMELLSPSDQIWVFGEDSASQRVTGSAIDFCLLATQRRHRDDCDVHATGSDADTWLNIAQAFAGPPGSGRGRNG